MPWGKLDDALYDHPKVELLPDGIRLACMGLWTLTNSYSNRHLTDGHVTTATLRKLGGTTRLVDALVGVGLYERNGTGILVHDFLDHNKSREQVLDERSKRADAGRLGGLARGRNLAKQAAEQTASNSLSNSEAKTKPPGVSPRPVPSRPGREITPTGSDNDLAREAEALSLDAFQDEPPSYEPEKEARGRR